MAPELTWVTAYTRHGWVGQAATSACSTTSACRRHRGGVAREKNKRRDGGGVCGTKHRLIALCLYIYAPLAFYGSTKIFTVAILIHALVHSKFDE